VEIYFLYLKHVKRSRFSLFILCSFSVDFKMAQEMPLGFDLAETNMVGSKQ
jgi:hypothetical protein